MRLNYSIVPVFITSLTASQKISEELDFAIKALLQTSRLTSSLTEIEQLGSTNLASTENFDALNPGRVEQKHTLNSNALKNSTNGDVGRHAGAPLGNHNSLVGLCPLLIAFSDFHANAHSVANMNHRKITFHLFRFE